MGVSMAANTLPFHGTHELMETKTLYVQTTLHTQCKDYNSLLNTLSHLASK